MEMKRREVRITKRDGKPIAKLCCPECGLVATLDNDQFHGLTSTQCTRCPFHDTVQWYKSVTDRALVKYYSHADNERPPRNMLR